jgi:rod shape-determining protein MreD
MNNTNKFRGIRYFAYAIEMLAVFVLQETPGLIPEAAGARPILLIPVTLSVSMFENETVSMVFGLAGGLLIDFGLGNVLGFHAMLLAAMCYAISLMTANLFQTNFLTAMLVAAISTASIVLLQWILFFVLYGYRYTGYALTAHYIPIFCYTWAFMPLTYYFNRALALQLRSKEE